MLTCLGAIPGSLSFLEHIGLCFCSEGTAVRADNVILGAMRLISTCLAKAVRSSDTSASWLSPLATSFPFKFPLFQLARYGGSAGPDPEPREVLEYDVCIVGAGPAGLAAAIRLKQVNYIHGAVLYMSLFFGQTRRSFVHCRFFMCPI
jgi:hypothetical protein